MRKRALAVLLVFAISILPIVQIKFLNVSANPYSMQFDPPPGYIIKSDGTVTGATLKQSGNVYTLTADMQTNIAIERQGVVLDGAGFAVLGSGKYIGIDVRAINVTIKNLNVRNFRVGIEFKEHYFLSKNPLTSSLYGNTIADNYYGIMLTGSYRFIISDNLFAENTWALSLSSSGFLRNNRFLNNEYALNSISDYDESDIDTSNTINGRAIYYWLNEHNKALPADAAVVIVKNSTNITIQNLDLNGNGQGILLYNTNNSVITGNKVHKNLIGIDLKNSNNNMVAQNQIFENKNEGIRATGAQNTLERNIISSNGGGITGNLHNSKITGNEIVSNSNDGIRISLEKSSVTKNVIAKNGVNGFAGNSMIDSIITGNNLIENGNYGVGFGFGESTNSTIKGNFISQNGLGIWICNAFKNFVISNNVTENKQWGIHLDGTQRDNVIYHNNFIDNKKTPQAYIPDHWIYPGLSQSDRGPEQRDLPQFVAGAANVWDNGVEGNYWSDYQGRAPYGINENNVDNHPLLVPHEISADELMPPNTALPSSSNQFNQENTVLVITMALSASAVAACLLLYFTKRKVNNFIKQ